MRYLISLFTGLGNAIQKTPLVSAIHQIDKQAQVDLIGDDRYGALSALSGRKFVHCIYTVPSCMSISHLVRWWLRLAARKYDWVFLPADASPRWLRYWAYFSNPIRVYQHVGTYRMRLRDRAEFFLKPTKVTMVPLVAGRHEIDMALDLLESAVAKPIRRNRQTWVSIGEDGEAIKRFNLPERYICLQIGAANGAKTAKRWPIEYFSKLITLLENRFPNYALVTVGDKGDYEHFVKPLHTNHPRVINTAGLTKIDEIAAILRRAKLLICHDSGLMHLANALDIPLIALYGPTDHYRTAPLGKRSVILRKPLPCSPCMYNNAISEAMAVERCPEPKCMYSITPEDVFHQIERVLHDAR